MTTTAALPTSTSIEQLFLEELETAGIHVCPECRDELLTLLTYDLLHEPLARHPGTRAG